MSDEYLLNRDRDESNRLEKQHQLWVDNLGFTIHPQITAQLPKNPRIADVGAGTGVWMRAVQAVLKNDVQLDGFDISDAQFSSDNAAPNVRFHVASFKDPFPASLQGQFDLVHLRLLCLALESHEFTSSVTNLMTLLKPGGWLQWEDFDGSPIRGLASTPSAHTEYLQSAFDHMIEMCGGRMFYPGTMLHPAFLESGLKNVHKRVVCSDSLPEHRELATEMEIGAFWGIGRQQISNGVPGAWSEEKLKETAEGMRRDVESGGYINFYMVYCIGQK